MNANESNLLEHVLEVLQGHKLKTIELATLQNAMPGTTEYDQFAFLINELIRQSVLEPIKARGTNRKNPPLPNKFAIRRGLLYHEHFEVLQRARLHLHPLIDLSAYYGLSPSRWEKDQLWLKLLDQYLKDQGLPVLPASLQERSFQIFRSEKWLEEKEGLDFLARVGLSFEKLLIVLKPDPCMFALQPSLYNDGIRKEHYHFIVENKTPFHALLPSLNQQTKYTSIIYGQGKAIISTLHNFFLQTGLDKKGNHCFHYYGDLDNEGINIWYSLQQRYHVQLAVPMYRGLLSKKWSYGKENQRLNEAALDAFLQSFTSSEKGAITSILNQGGYLPQEALTAEETIAIWGQT